MIYHQPTNTFGKNIYNAFIYSGCGYGLHFHRSFEFIYCLFGKCEVSIGENSFSLCQGESAISFPYQVHSFSVPKDAKLYVLVFSGEFSPYLMDVCKSGVPENPKIEFRDYEKDFLFSTLLKDTRKPEDFTYNAALNVICAGLMRGAKFLGKGKNDFLIMKIIDYIENNFCEDITLKTLAGELGYNYQYLSRLFRGEMKMNFRSLINQYRINKANELISTGEKSVTEAAFESGFGSVRNYNRVKKQLNAEIKN